MIESCLGYSPNVKICGLRYGHHNGHRQNFSAFNLVATIRGLIRTPTGSIRAFPRALLDGADP